MKAGWNSLKTAKLRSFWTMLGVIIGVASVITVVSIGEGVKQQISGELKHLGADLISVRPSDIRAGGSTAGTSSLLAGLPFSGNLTGNDVAAVSRTKGVVASAPLSVVTGNVSGDNGQYKDGYVVGTTSDLSTLLRQNVQFGSFLTEDDMGSNAAVIGRHAADELFNENVPLGRSFKFHGQEFFVRGIFDDSTASLFSEKVNVNNSIFIPYDVAQQLTKNSAATYQILAKSDSKTDTSKVATAIKHELDHIHGGESAASVQLGSEQIATNDTILNLLTRMIAGVAAISLLVGGIGIMNVMLVSVAERVHEIGIRKAVGATNQQILNQFLAEATVLSLVGGVIGIVIALATVMSLRVLTDLKPVITWEIVAVATLVSLLVGIIFGTAPALKAARKDPIDALRAE
jgi:ABC-type antimicrobial peptide transport system permease subunit